MDGHRGSRQRITIPSPESILGDAELTNEIQRGVASLKRWPGLRRIWLFGSAARGEVLDGRSDLDFAVQGLAPEHLERAWAMLDEAVRLPVDLVRIEAANDSLRQAIWRDGRILYEA